MVSTGERRLGNCRRVIGNLLRTLLCSSMTVKTSGDEPCERLKSDTEYVNVTGTDTNCEEGRDKTQLSGKTSTSSLNSPKRPKKLPTLKTVLNSHLRLKKGADRAKSLVFTGDVFSDPEFPSLYGLPMIDMKSLTNYEVIDDMGFSEINGTIQDEDKLAILVMDPVSLDRTGGILRKLSGYKSFPTLHGVTRLDGGHYGIVQDMVYGEDFESLRCSGELANLSLRDKVYIALQLCSAVSRMHGFGIIHLNICSDTIIIDKKTLTLTLIGFRNAAPIEDASTRRGIGSLPYIAPEAVFDNGITSFKEDIWSVGMILATLFTGLTPYQSELDESRLHDVHEANENLPRYRQKPSANVEMKLYSQQGKMMEQVGTLINLSVCPTPGLRPSAKNLLDAFAMLMTTDTQVA